MAYSSSAETYVNLPSTQTLVPKILKLAQDR